MKRAAETAIGQAKKAKEGTETLEERLHRLRRQKSHPNSLMLVDQYHSCVGEESFDDDGEDKEKGVFNERLLHVLTHGHKRHMDAAVLEKDMEAKKKEVEMAIKAMKSDLANLKAEHENIMSVGNNPPPLYRLVEERTKMKPRLTASQKKNGYFFISGHAFISLLQDDQVGGVFAYQQDDRAPKPRCAYCRNKAGNHEDSSAFEPLMGDVEDRHAYGICGKCIHGQVYHDYPWDFGVEKGDADHTCETIRNALESSIRLGESLLIAPFHVNEGRKKRSDGRLYFRKEYRLDVDNPYVNQEGWDIYTYLNIRCIREDKYYYENVFPAVVERAKKNKTPLEEIHGYNGMVGAPPPVRRVMKLRKLEKSESDSESEESTEESDSDSGSDESGSESQ